jgi:hypothetical protein
MFDIILGAIKLAGSELPAFKSLFDGVVGTLHESDQAKLKAAYAEQMAKSDAVHQRVQDM